MAGFPFETVIFKYFQEKADKSGHKEETSRYNVKVLWNGNVTLREREQRYHGKNINAEIKVMFDKRIPKPSPKILLIEREGDNYKVVNEVDDLPSKIAFYRLGLEETKRDTP